MRHYFEVSDELRVTRSCAIPLAEIKLRFETSSGPGGQHANRSRTRVEVSFDVTASPSLNERDRQRLRDKLGEVVRAAADDERSQSRNRSLALERLRSKLALALRQERPRRPTKPTKASKERRLEGKRRRSSTKRDRRPPTPDQ